MSKEKIYMTDKLRDRISLVPKDKKGRWKTLDIFQVAKEQALEIDNQQAEIEGLKIIIKDLERRLDHAEWLVDKYREEEDTK